MYLGRRGDGVGRKDNRRLGRKGRDRKEKKEERGGKGNLMFYNLTTDSNCIISCFRDECHRY